VSHYPGAIGITFRFMKDSFRNNFLVCWSSHPGFMRARFQVNKAQFRVSRGHTSRLWELTSRFNESSLPSLWQLTSELHESSLPGFTKDRIDESSNYLGIDIQDASANDKTQILLSSFLYVLNFHCLNLRFARVLTCV
jgi:hypothetical protein